MPVIKYPIELPSPHFKSNIQRQKNFLSTDMESGDGRLRRRFKNVPYFVQVYWRLSAIEAVAFEGWVEHELEGGTSWFELKLRTPSGVQTVLAQFVNHPFENEQPRGTKWLYTARLKIKDRAVPSEDLMSQKLAESILVPHTVSEFVSGISKALDSYQE